MRAKTILTIILTALAAAASFGLLALLGPDWTRYAPASCLTTRCFCEVPRTGALILQPANSWSSFGFVIIGVWIALTSNAKQGNSAFTGYAAIWFGLTAIVIGVGSFLLHATLTLWGQFYDNLGMYLTSAFLIAYAVRRWRGWSDARAVALYLGLCAILLSFLVAIPETRRWLFAVILIGGIILELGFARPHRPGIAPRWFVWGIVLQATAFAIWILDLNGTLCNGPSLLQGHAVWHLLNACALGCNYLYYRSERAIP
jgi:Ceramidase